MIDNKISNSEHLFLGFLCATLLSTASNFANADPITLTPPPADVEELRQKLEQRDTTIKNLWQRVEKLEQQAPVTPEQTESPPSPPPPGVEESQQKLEQRETVINDLLQRIEKLEQQAPVTPEHAETPPPPPETSETQTPPTSAEKDKPDENKDAAPVPGQFEVDEDAAERALERTLVQTGALLLQTWHTEIDLGFTYIRNQAVFDFTLFSVSELTDAEFVIDKENRDVIEASLQLRIGLPFDSQLELSIPYRYADESTVREFEELERNSETSTSGHGAGDIVIGLAKTLLHEKHWWPDVIARIEWDSKTGKDLDNIALGSFGFHELTGSLSLAKRQDPLVFTLGLSYGTTFEEKGIEPGDDMGLSAGVHLAASPETSLRAALSQTFFNEDKRDNKKIKGTNEVNAVVTLGASSRVGRRKFIDISTGIGLTDAASDYSVNFSFSSRFNLLGR